VAEAIAISDRRIDGGPPRVPAAAQELIHFFLQHPLQEALHSLPREGFERLPFGP
jgi:hypothetical protein